MAFFTADSTRQRRTSELDEDPLGSDSDTKPTLPTSAPSAARASRSAGAATTNAAAGLVMTLVLTIFLYIHMAYKIDSFRAGYDLFTSPAGPLNCQVIVVIVVIGVIGVVVA